MACDHWRRQGVLEDVHVRLVLPGRGATGVAHADAVLERVFTSYGIEVLREARVEAVDATRRSITVTTPAGRQVAEGIDVAHVVPHYRAPEWIADSGLAATRRPGLVDIDPRTLRHRRHAAVWGIGDAADLATRSSGGGLRHQVKILSHNIAAARDGGRLDDYDGYTVMPVTVGRHTLMLAEADRDGRVPTAARLLDLAKPRRSLWFLDRYVLPPFYWRRILRGRV